MNKFFSLFFVILLIPISLWATDNADLELQEALRLSRQEGNLNEEEQVQLALAISSQQQDEVDEELKLGFALSVVDQQEDEVDEELKLGLVLSVSEEKSKEGRISSEKDEENAELQKVLQDSLRPQLEIQEEELQKILEFSKREAERSSIQKSPWATTTISEGHLVTMGQVVKEMGNDYSKLLESLEESNYPDLNDRLFHFTKTFSSSTDDDLQEAYEMTSEDLETLKVRVSTRVQDLENMAATMGLKKPAENKAGLLDAFAGKVGCSLGFAETVYKQMLGD